MYLELKQDIQNDMVKELEAKKTQEMDQNIKQQLEEIQQQYKLIEEEKNQMKEELEKVQKEQKQQSMTFVKKYTLKDN